MTDLAITHHFSSGVYVRQMHLPAGHVAQTHLHRFDHLSILAQGEVILSVNGVHSRHQAPACLTIAAHAAHQILALSDCVWFCLHATQETEVEHIHHQLVEAD